jgi:hypothetical protein
MVEDVLGLADRLEDPGLAVLIALEGSVHL